VKTMLAVLTLAFVVMSCASADPAQNATSPSQGSAIATTGIAPGVVSGEAAHTLVATGIKVVDVRTPAEYASGHVPGAVNIPFDEMPQRYAEVGPPSTPILVYCKTGRRSGIAIGTLRQKGFTTIYDLQAYDRWVSAEPPSRAQ
jgi:phage shock protein E